MSGALIVFIIIAAVTLMLIAASVKIVPESQVWVVERLGQFFTLWETGVHFGLPFIDCVFRKVDMREQLLELSVQDVRTNDGSAVRVEMLLFFAAADPQRFAYGVERPAEALRSLTEAALREIVGGMELEEARGGRRSIGSRLTNVIGKAAEVWGVGNVRAEQKLITTK